MKRNGIKCFAKVSLMILVALAGTPRASHAAQEVVAWGNDTYGQATPPGGLSNVVAIAAGDTYSLALTADGQVTAWGEYYNYNPPEYYVPTTVPAGLSNVVAITAGSSFNLGLKDDGTVVAWGG